MTARGIGRVAAIAALAAVGCDRSRGAREEIPGMEGVVDVVPIQLTVDDVVGVGSGDADRLFAEAVVLLDTARPEDRRAVRQARKMLQRVVELDATHARAHVHMARVERFLGYIDGRVYREAAVDRAMVWADRALQLDPILAEAHLQRAVLDYFRGSLNDAEVAQKGLTAAVTRGQQGEALTVLADVYAKNNRRKDARRCYKALIELHPSSGWMHGNYAQFLLRTRRTDEAVKMAERAVELTNYPAGHSLLSSAYVAKGSETLWRYRKVAPAKELFERAIAEVRENAEAQYGLAACLEFASRKAPPERKAVLRQQLNTELLTTLALDPDHKKARIALERLSKR